jgi:23S rRNA (cytosine1962-C5)-methyltransferase
MKYHSFHPNLFPRMVGAASSDAAAGDLVKVYEREGGLFGAGFYNPKAHVPLRVMYHGADDFGERDLDERLHRAIALRMETLKLGTEEEAYRVFHSDGDGISGLVVDRYADMLSIEITTLGVWRRIRRWLPMLHQKLGTKAQVISVDPEIARIESMRYADVPEMDDPAPKSVRIREHGVRYQVNFDTGHKTGFFCDQRENRLRFAKMARGRVLDLCAYTGGFSLGARVIGGCEDVTGVDLDEKAIEQAKQNANLNQTRLNWIHADAFSWARQMIANDQQWDTVVLDPPKLVHSRDPEDEGRKKYNDLNVLALQLVKRGGLFVTCSCSGLLGADEFEHIVIKAAHRYHRKLQILDRTGAGPDHPMMSNCPEGRYLKLLWCVVW